MKRMISRSKNKSRVRKPKSNRFKAARRHKDRKRKLRAAGKI
jgi:hypothetical protein